MKNLTFEQRIALQMGELILEVKRLETIRDQMANQLSELAQEKQGYKLQAVHKAPESPPT